MDRTLARDLPEHRGKEVRVAGHLQDYRALGSLGFAILRDRSGLLQVTLKKGETPEEVFAQVAGLNRESVISVTGLALENPKAKVGSEVLARSVEVLTRAEAPLPLGVVDKVGADLDTRLDHRFMDLRKRENQNILELRDSLMEGLRHAFRAMDFIEVETPKILRQGAEGGATLFAVDYFGQKAYLAQSPQLYKQMLMSTDLERVFEIAPAFRAEPSATSRHLTEFTSVDAEMAYIRGPEDLWDTVEHLVLYTLEYTRRELTKDGNPLVERLPEVKIPFPRIPYTEAKAMIHGNPEEDLSSEDEKALGEVVPKERGNEFYFITEFPSSLKRGTFYAMRRDDDPAKTNYFDLDFRGLELVSGGQREHRIEHLSENIRSAGLDPAAFPSYLESFRFGMPPHGGFALGLDRLTARLAGLANIREARLFPRDRFRLEP